MLTNDIGDLVLNQAREILGKEGLTLEDDFFDAGGDSIVGMHFVGRVGRLLSLPVRTTLLFGNPVLRDFAAEVAALRQLQSMSSEGVAKS